MMRPAEARAKEKWFTGIPRAIGVEPVSQFGVPEAIVALVPHDPLHNAGPLYRTAIADNNGKFELRGIRPGSYRLFAWPDLEGAAYRNEDFMKAIGDKGLTVKVEKDIPLVIDLPVLK